MVPHNIFIIDFLNVTSVIKMNNVIEFVFSVAFINLLLVGGASGHDTDSEETASNLTDRQPQFESTQMSSRADENSREEPKTTGLCLYLWDAFCLFFS